MIHPRRGCAAVARCTTKAAKHSRAAHSASSGARAWRSGFSSFINGALVPEFVKVVEVGARDGLQNEKKVIPTATKVELIDRLSAAGVSYVEATSFVRKDIIPQLSDAPEVMAGIKRAPKVRYAALTPNIKGLEKALESKVDEVAVFAAASDSFSQKNINCGVMDSLERFKPVLAAAATAGVPVRGYVSVVAGCPYSGYVAPDAVSFVAQSLLEMGCVEISLGDTIGVATPRSIQALLTSVREHVPLSRVALHCHDTYGQALANVHAALEMGVTVFDSSVAGLGGCPYARGASGNVATEDLVYMLHGLGIRTGIDLDQIADVGVWISGLLDRPNRSKVGVARAAQKASLASGKDQDLVRIGLSWPNAHVSGADATATTSAAAAPSKPAATSVAAPAPTSSTGGPAAVRDCV